MHQTAVPHFDAPKRATGCRHGWNGVRRQTDGVQSAGPGAILASPPWKGRRNITLANRVVRYSLRQCEERSRRLHQWTINDRLNPIESALAQLAHISTASQRKSPSAGCDSDEGLPIRFKTTLGRSVRYFFSSIFRSLIASVPTLVLRPDLVKSA